MIDVLYVVSLVSIAAATVLFFIYAYKQIPVYFNTGTMILFAGTLSLGILLFVTGILKNRHPTTSSFEIFNFIAFLVLIMYFVFEYKFKVRLLSVFLPTISLFLLLFSLSLPHEDFRFGNVFSVTLLSTHITFSLIGEAGFLLAAVAAAMYLMQEKNLKSKRFDGSFFKLPSLNRLERMAHFSLVLGFPFLTVGLILGIVQAVKSLGGGWILDIKIVISLITWIAYLLLFILRTWKRLYGKTFITWLIITFILVVIGYIAANYFSGFHFFIYSGGS